MGANGGARSEIGGNVSRDSGEVHGVDTIAGFINVVTVIQRRDKNVIAWAAKDSIIAAIAKQNVVAATAPERVVTDAAMVLI